MQQNKAQFIMDYYVEVKWPGALNVLVDVLLEEEIKFAVEPWPGKTRVYVRKENYESLEIAWHSCGEG